jgi:hypothetical protein
MRDASAIRTYISRFHAKGGQRNREAHGARPLFLTITELTIGKSSAAEANALLLSPRGL